MTKSMRASVSIGGEEEWCITSIININIVHLTSTFAPDALSTKTAADRRQPPEFTAIVKGVKLLCCFPIPSGSFTLSAVNVAILPLY